MKDKIFQALVPKEKQIEIKNGKRKIVEKRIFQGYVLVQMKMSEDAWYIVRNTPSVTGFVGRITSYNVCYTKLLRSVVTFDRLVDLFRGRAH